jgi:hypothetical protein
MRIRSLRWTPLVLEAGARSLAVRLRWGSLNLLREASRPTAGSARTRGRGPPPAVIHRAVQVATGWGPLRTTCLVRAIVLTRMLRARGNEASVVLGVSDRGVSSEDRFAHAWVETSSPSPQPGYRELARLSP